MSFSIEHYVVGPVATNCYFMINDDTGEAIVVDPGAAAKSLSEKLREGSHTPVAVLLTHGHFDHAGGVEELLRQFSGEDIPVYAYRGERQVLEDPGLNLSGGMGGHAETYHATDYLEDGDEFTAAGFDIRLLYTPGHTPGGCCFYLQNQGICFTGDTLFCGSVGRSDFPGGSASQLVSAIREKLLVLPDDTVCYPGHDSVTTIGDEKKYNPFIQ